MVWRSRKAIAIWPQRAITAFVAVVVATLAAPAAGADCDGARSEVALDSVTENLELKLEDGRVIRLAGLDLPASSRAAAETLLKVRADLAAVVADGVASLVLLSDKPDRWGRWLGALYGIDPPYESYALRLLTQGDARLRPEFETRACAAERMLAEAKAIAARLGVWADPDYGVRKAGGRATWVADDGRFIVVEGVVHRVGLGRSRLYLDFGARNDLSATVTSKGETAFLHAGVKLRELKGTRVRIRGVLDMRYAPRIDLVDVSALQVLTSAPGSP
jgi:endonuclease YncB( thermonuclease family)